MRGDGRIFRKAGSRFWHMAYYVDGREVSESTKQTDEERARRELTHRIAEVRARKALPHESRVTLGRVPTCESCGESAPQTNSRTGAEVSSCKIRGPSTDTAPRSAGSTSASRSSSTAARRLPPNGSTPAVRSATNAAARLIAASVAA